MMTEEAYNLYCFNEEKAGRNPIPWEAWLKMTRKKLRHEYMTDYRVLMTGSRTWEDRERMYWVLYQILGGIKRKNGLLVHGDAEGADRMAAEIWAKWGGKVEAHPVTREDFKEHGKKAYYLRNQLMVDKGADLCIAFIREGSAGASMTADLAEKARIKTVRIEA